MSEVSRVLLISLSQEQECVDKVIDFSSKLQSEARGSIDVIDLADVNDQDGPNYSAKLEKVMRSCQGYILVCTNELIQVVDNKQVIRGVEALRENGVVNLLYQFGEIDELKNRTVLVSLKACKFCSSAPSKLSKPTFSSEDSMKIISMIASMRTMKAGDMPRAKKDKGCTVT